MRTVSRKDSLYVQLLFLLILSAVISAGCFFLINGMNDMLLEQCFNTSEYSQKKNSVYVQKLQEYINENQICSRDIKKIKMWTKNQKIISVRIYKDNIEVFDSDYPDKDIWEEDIAANEHDWETYYSIRFADGDARIGIIGHYEYQLFNYMTIADLIISFLLFLIIVLCGIRRKISYISILYDEIKILEGGSLNYVVTTKGRDELSALAEGLNGLRLAFQEMLEREAEVLNKNNLIITEMSHDLRTPITSIFLYTEILKKLNMNSEKYITEYIQKIENKAYRMKQLAEHLFEYSLTSGEVDITLEKPEYVEILFADLMSETCKYLRDEGFEINFTVKWEAVRIQIYTEYIVRIFDNIVSNILKYADRHHEIDISSQRIQDEICFIVSNKIKLNYEKRDSNGIGIHSIDNMMRKMNGYCLMQEEYDTFQLRLVFPICCYENDCTM